VAKLDTPSNWTEDLTTLLDGHCLFTTPWLIGFDLKRHQWAKRISDRELTSITDPTPGRFLIDKLEDAVWNNKVFDNLLLPGGEKELA
jgi:hypothetical protein